jgi:hypothetical protein
MAFTRNRRSPSIDTIRAAVSFSAPTVGIEIEHFYVAFPRWLRNGTSQGYHRGHEESRPVWSLPLPRYVYCTGFLSLSVGIYVFYEHLVVHHEAHWLPSSPVRRWIVAQGKDMNASVVR